MESRENKRRWKLNVFDIIIIAVVIVAAGVFLYFWRFSGNSSTAVNTTPVHYTIELNGMLEGTSQKIKEGDTIMDSTKKFIMGTVVSLTVMPATTTEVNLETGDTIEVEVPGKEAALIEIVCPCSSSDTEIKAESGYVVRIGSEVTASGPGYAGKGYVLAINREDLR